MAPLQIISEHGHQNRHMVAMERNQDANENPPEIQPPAEPGAVPPEEQPVVFALTPASAQKGVIINYGSRDGIKYFERATKPLYDENDKFDADAEGLHTFLELLSERARTYQWADEQSGVLSIPDNPEQAERETQGATDLITGYGQKTLEEVRKWEATYIDTKTRLAQDTIMLYHCLFNSLSIEGKQKVMPFKADYTINDKPSGVLFLKVIVRESSVDSQATSTAIRKRMAELPNYIKDIGGDIMRFNRHVRLLVHQLRARGEKSNDLLVFVVNAYKKVKDKNFAKWVDDKESKYEDGEIELTVEKLMKQAESKYKILLDKNQWKQPTPEDDQISALQAQIKNLKKGANKGKGNRKKSSNAKPDWLEKDIKPKESEDLSKPRKWGGNEYYWCDDITGGKCGGVWRCHLPSKCHTDPKGKDSHDSKRNQKRAGPASKKRNAGHSGKSNKRDKKVKILSAMESAARSAAANHTLDDSSSSGSGSEAE